MGLARRRVADLTRLHTHTHSMNKKRPRERMDPGDTLCRPLLTKGECLFGPERCRFSHDIAGFLKRKEKVGPWAWVCSWLVGLGAWGLGIIK